MIDVVGLDLSLTGTGIARTIGPDADDDVELSTIVTGADGVERIDHIEDAVLTMCRGVDLVVIEDFSYGSKGAGAREIGGLGWVIRLALWRHGVRFALVPPSNLKKYATGKGSATKADVRMSVFKRYGRDIGDDNQADAFVLRSMGCDVLGLPVIRPPAVNRSALDKLSFPTLDQIEAIA